MTPYGLALLMRSVWQYLAAIVTGTAASALRSVARLRIVSKLDRLGGSASRQFIDSAGKYNRCFSGQADNEEEHKTDRDRITALELELHLHGPQVIEIKAVLPTAWRRSP